MHRRFVLKTAPTIGMAMLSQHLPLSNVAANHVDQAPAPAAIKEWSALDTYIEQARRDWQVPGASIAIVNDDAPVFASGFGFHDARQSRRVTEQSLFALASTTKAFGALSLAMLVDERKLDWDDKIVKHLPSFKVLDADVTREMTIRDVLSHRTGVRDSGLLDAAYPQPQLFERLRNLDQAAPFRSRFVYNNLLYRLPGAIVEAVTHRQWDTFVRERILSPLGMHHTQTSAKMLAGLADVARMGRLSGGQVQTFAPRAFEREVSSAGSFYSTARDMAAWLRLHLDDGSVDGQRLVSRESMAALREPAIIEPIATNAWGHVYSETVTSTYALGWQVRDHRGHLVIEHGGRNNGMSAHVGYLPRLRVGVVVLSNLGTPSPGFPDAVAYRIYDLCIGATPTDWSRRALAHRPAESPSGDPPRIAGTVPSRPLQEYVGRYAHHLYGEARVVLGEKSLRLHWFGRDGVEATLDHWHLDTFRTQWGEVGYRLPAFVSFSLDAYGRVAFLTPYGVPGHFNRLDVLRP